MSLAMAASFAVSAGETELQAGYAEWRAEAKYGCLAVSDGTREAYLVTAPATAARGFAAPQAEAPSRSVSTYDGFTPRPVHKLPNSSGWKSISIGASTNSTLLTFTADGKPTP